MNASPGGTDCSERRRGRSRQSQSRGDARAQAFDTSPRARSLTPTQQLSHTHHSPTHSPLCSRTPSPSPCAEEQDSEEPNSQSRKRRRPPFSSKTKSQLVPTQENGTYDFSARLPPPPAMLSCPVCSSKFPKFPSLSAHLRGVHSGVQLDADVERELNISRCSVCTVYYRSTASGGLPAHRCDANRRKPTTSTLAAQLTCTPQQHHGPRPLPVPPGGLSWVAGSPQEDHMWFLSPLLYSLAVASSDAAATAAGLSAFYAGSNWNTWREHFSAELVGGQVTLEPSESRDTLVNLLAGADTQIRCLMQGCEHNFHTVLQLVDHINISHPDHCAFAGQHQDVKLCPCGKVFMDTAYGRRCHASWCEHIRISLLSPPPSSPASVQILELSNRCRASVDNRMVYLADLTLHAYEWGASFGGDTNICYYLSTTAPDSMPDTWRGCLAAAW